MESVFICRLLVRPKFSEFFPKITSKIWGFFRTCRLDSWTRLVVSTRCLDSLSRLVSTRLDSSRYQNSVQKKVPKNSKSTVWILDPGDTGDSPTRWLDSLTRLADSTRGLADSQTRRT